MTASRKTSRAKRPAEACSSDRRAAVRFNTTLHQAKGKNATGIVIPPEALERLSRGKRPPVRVRINGYEFRTTVGVMGGQAMISVSAAIRRDTGLAAGDNVKVELVVDETPRMVEMPADFARALAAARGMKAFFDALPNSLQRYHIDNINDAKAEETRQRRIDKAIALFRAGKKR